MSADCFVAIAMGGKNLRANGLGDTKTQIVALKIGRTTIA